MADYLYGKLNTELELAEYTGKETGTANVEIDNSDHTIEVNVKGLPIPEDKRESKGVFGHDGEENKIFDISGGNTDEVYGKYDWMYVTDIQETGNQTARITLDRNATEKLSDVTVQRKPESRELSLQNRVYAPDSDKHSTFQALVRSGDDSKESYVTITDYNEDGKEIDASRLSPTTIRCYHNEWNGSTRYQRDVHFTYDSMATYDNQRHPYDHSAYYEDIISHANSPLTPSITPADEGKILTAKLGTPSWETPLSMANGEGTNSIKMSSDSIASGDYSFAAGLGTIASNESMTSMGSYNVPPTTNEIFSIGNGTSDTDRQNAFTVDKDGTVDVLSKINIGVYDASTLDHYSSMTSESIRFESLNGGNSIVIDRIGITIYDGQGQVSKSKTWDQILG